MCTKVIYECKRAKWLIFSLYLYFSHYAYYTHMNVSCIIHMNEYNTCFIYVMSVRVRFWCHNKGQKNLGTFTHKAIITFL